MGATKEKTCENLMDFATTVPAWSDFIVPGKALHQRDLERFFKWPLAAAGDRQLFYCTIW